MGEVTIHVAIVVNINRPPFEHGINKLIKRQIRAPPSTVDGKKAEHCCRNIPQMRIGMGHGLIGFFRCGIDGQRCIGLVIFMKGHLSIGAIYRRCRRHHQMRHPMHPGRFHHIEGTKHIALHIDPWVFQTVAHTRLRRQMHDDIQFRRSNGIHDRFLILQHCGDRIEVFVLAKHLEPPMFEPHIIIISKTV